MNKVKKILSLILVVILFMTAVPMETLAAPLDWLRPFVYKVEFIDNNPISNSYVQRHNDMLDVDKAYILPTDDIYNYVCKLYFSNGRTIEISKDNVLGSDLISVVTSVDMAMILDTAECQKASYMGEGVVNVKVKLNVNYLYGEPREFTLTTKKEIVSGIVMNVRLLDPVPYYYNTVWPYDDFVGKRFQVTYADGSKKTYTFRNNSYYYGLEDIRAELSYGENKYIDKETGELVYYKGLDIFFIDASFPIERKKLPCPYKSLKITNYLYNGEGGLIGLSYALTYNNKKTTTKSFIFDTPLKYGESQIIDKIDGYDITVSVDSKDELYSIKAKIGYDIWDLNSEVTGKFSKFCDCKCHKTGWLREFFHSIRNAFWKLFRTKEVCQCGMVHWTKEEK